MVKESIEERSRGRLDRQEMTPLLEWPMTRQTQAAVFVGGGNEAEQQLRASFVERSKPELIDEDQVVAQDRRIRARPGVSRCASGRETAIRNSLSYLS